MVVVKKESKQRKSKLDGNLLTSQELLNVRGGNSPGDDGGEGGGGRGGF